MRATIFTIRWHPLRPVEVKAMELAKAYLLKNGYTVKATVLDNNVRHQVCFTPK